MLHSPWLSRRDLLCHFTDDRIGEKFGTRRSKKELIHGIGAPVEIGYMCVGCIHSPPCSGDDLQNSSSTALVKDLLILKSTQSYSQMQCASTKVMQEVDILSRWELINGVNRPTMISVKPLPVNRSLSALN